MFSNLYNIKELILGGVKNHFVVILCLLLAALATIISRLSLQNYLSFVLVQYFCIYIPGKAFHLFLNKDDKNELTQNLVSYALGYSLSIVFYLLFLIIGIQGYIIFFYPVISLISILFLLKFKKSQKCIKPCFKESFSFGVILFFAVLISTVLYQYQNLSPTIQKGNILYYQDLIFWLRNCVAATKSYPLPELSVMGDDFYYHYFTSIEIAFLHFTTKIEMFDLCFTYSYIVTLFILISGLYVLLKELVDNAKLVVIALCFILFTSGFEFLTHIYFSQHIYRATFGLPEGLGFFCFCYTYYIKWFKHREKYMSYAVISLLFLITCTGLKGPIAAVLLVGIGLGCLMLLIQNHNWGKVSLVGISHLLVFILILVYFVIGNKASEEGSSSELIFSSVNTLFHSHYFDKVFYSIYNIIHIKTLSYLMTLFLFLVSSMLIPISVLYTTMRKQRIRFDIINVSMWGMIVCGILLCIFVSQNGMSQMYFMFVSIVCMFIVGFSTYSFIIKARKSNYTPLYILLFVGVVLFIVQIPQNGKQGIKNAITDFSFYKVNKYEKKETGKTINFEEMKGLRWIRDHIPSNSVLLSNKVLAEEGGRSFVTSAFSERQTYYESYAYSNQNQKVIENKLNKIKSFYYGGKDISDILKKEGVTHAIVYKNIYPNSYPSNNNIIFENEDLIVLEL